MRNKYGAKQIMIDGHMFPSHREAEYYLTYKAMLDDGEIVNLELQPRFTLIPAYTNQTGHKAPLLHIHYLDNLRLQNKPFPLR